MSQITKDINKITGTIIGISGKLILYALVLLLLVEGITRGYAFGHGIFYAEAMEAAPGTDKVVEITKSVNGSETARLLRDAGLIDNELAVEIQLKVYKYKVRPGTYTLNTSMTSKEILRLLNDGPQETQAGIPEGNDPMAGVSEGGAGQ